jgi:hypothetical protein
MKMWDLPTQISFLLRDLARCIFGRYLHTTVACFRTTRFTSWLNTFNLTNAL